jgi:3-dehydroquinate synthase
MKISSYRGQYRVNFTNDYLHSLEIIIQKGDVLLLDSKISELYENKLSKFKITNSTLVIPEGENSKSFDASKELIQELMEIGFKRNHRLIAIGGGIVQDAVAFVASVLFRGVDWIFFPTTLLAQGDSCIGSKTSVNFASYKNLLGGFHPPKEIYIDSSFLSSLGEKEIKSGLGEMLHFFMIGGRGDFEMFRDNFEKSFNDASAIKLLTQRSLEIKKDMIEMDEFDQGSRKIFNYGHTFGHALEGITNYKIPHGIAVAYGMDMANKASVYYGLLDDSISQESKQLFSKIWKNTFFPKIDTTEYLNLLSKDKKNVGNKLNLILTRGWGDMFMHEVVPDDGFAEVVDKCLNSYHFESNHKR